MTAVRVQRSRRRGWRKPPNTVCVSRPSVLGNPFDWVVLGRELAVDFFRRWLAGEMSTQERAGTGIDLPCPTYAERQRNAILALLPSLRGKNLCCWCAPGEPCHADVLLEMANR